MIRNGELSDAAAMAHIYNHYVRTSPVIFSNRTLSGDDMRDKLRRLGAGRQFPFLVAEADGAVAGYAYAHLWQPDPVYAHTWELTIYLAPEACGRGLGTELITRLVEACRRQGAHTLVSCVTQGNTPCERLHLRAGFGLAGVLKAVGHKFGRYHDDALYQLQLEA